MIKTKRIEELSGFRNPNENEKKVISDYFAIGMQKKIRFQKRCSTVLCVFGVMNCGFYASSGVLSLIIALVAFGLAFSCIWSKKGCQEKMRIFAQGRFRVLEGNVYEISVNPDSPGFFNVRFQSKYREVLTIWYRVRQEELQIGTPLLLVYVDTNTIKGGLAKVFSPYMLTVEGMKYQL